MFNIYYLALLPILVFCLFLKIQGSGVLKQGKSLSLNLRKEMSNSYPSQLQITKNTLKEMSLT